MNPDKKNRPPQQDQDSAADITPDAGENQGIEFTEASTPSERPDTPPPTQGNVRPMKPWEIEEALKESGAEQAIPQQTMVIGLDEDEKERRKKEKEQTLVTGEIPEEKAEPKIVYNSVTSSHLQKNKGKLVKPVVFTVIGFVVLVTVSAFAIYNL